jgi:hypothetical protein
MYILQHSVLAKCVTLPTALPTDCMPVEAQSCNIYGVFTCSRVTNEEKMSMRQCKCMTGDIRCTTNTPSTCQQ